MFDTLTLLAGCDKGGNKEFLNLRIKSSKPN